MENNKELNSKQANNTITPKKKSVQKLLPNSQHDLLLLAENVCKKWEETSGLTLLWINYKEFKKTIQDYRISLENKMEAGNERGSQTQTLRDLDTQIDKAVEETKLAILVKFGKEKGKAYFSEFNITKQGSSYKLPRDRNMRMNALPFFVKAIKKHEIIIVNFDNKFFENIIEAYTEAFNATQKTDSTVSINVSNKNDSRKQIEAVLTALHALIRINYPNTYEGELRGWGFQKEKY